MNTVRTKQRIKKYGEVFTPMPLVNEVLDKLPKEAWEEGKTTLDPACGNGNFLVAVLQRKLARGHDPLTALSTIYGVDILRDNVLECRKRLREELMNHLHKHNMEQYAKKRAPVIELVLFHNIVWHDALTYHFRFDGTVAEDKYEDQPI